MRPGHAATDTTDAGTIVRRARQARGLTLAEFGRRTGFSASQISRYETGTSPLTDVNVLRRFADTLGIAPETVGLLPRTVTVASAVYGEDDPVRRRQLLAGFAVTAAATAGAPLAGTSGKPDVGRLLLIRVRDAMLAPDPGEPVPTARLRAGLAAAFRDYHACRYRRLADSLPRLIAGGHALTAANTQDPCAAALLAEIYTLTTRMLIKLEAAELGWMAADRARLVAAGAQAPLVAAEAARNMAVLARRAGWYDQATAIALGAADDPTLAGGRPQFLAERGLLITSAAYTAAKAGDKSTMRALTDDADAIAAGLGGTLLRDHGGGLSTTAVHLHRISAEYSAGDPGAAIAATRKIRPQELPTVERRARFYTDIARAYGQWGRRDECLRALLAAERLAPEEIHAKPAVRSLLTGLLISGRTSPDLRGLATRSGIT